MSFRRGVVKGLITTLIASILPFIAAIPAAQAKTNSKATICHRTNSLTNPYRLITVSRSSFVGNKGHALHTTSPERVWTPTSTKAEGWGDIIPGVLNWTTAGQDIYYGRTKTAKGIPACRAMTFSQYYASEKAAGQTDAQIADDLDDGASEEDKATLATFGSGCTKFTNCASQLQTISNNSKAIAAVTTFATNVTASQNTASATLNGYVKTDSNSIKYFFEYSTDGSWVEEPTKVPTNSAGPLATNTTTNVFHNLSGLTPNTTYYYRIVAEYTAGGAVQYVSGDLVSFEATSSPRYVVKYDANGGTDGLAPVDTKRYPGNSPTKVFDNYGGLTKNGRAFVGWSLSPTNTLRFDPNQQTVLLTGSASKFYSKFARMTFLKASTTQSFANGTYVGGDDITVVNSDITLYAIYSTSFTVTYNPNTAGSGTAPTDATAYSSGATVNVAGNTGTLAKSGYRFNGWCTVQIDPGVACSGTTQAPGSTFSIAADVTLYAIWAANRYVYDGNTSDSGTPPADSVFAGVALTARANTFTKAGYSFYGWCTVPAAAGNNCTSGTRYTAGATLLNPETTTVTLYATWSNATIYTLTFDSQLGSSVDPINFIANDSITLPSNPTRTGYTFTGWFTVPTGGTQVTSPYSPPSSNTTLYARWSASSYQVTYYGNDNTSGTPPGAVTKLYNESHTVLGPGNLAKTGHTFGGWNTDSDGTGNNYVENDTFTVLGAVDLFAKWVAETYPVTYDGNTNDSGSAPSSQTKVYGVTLTLASGSGSLVKSGFNFAGWNTAANGSGTAYASGASYALNAALVLYAQWTAANSGGGSGGSVAPTPPPPPAITSLSRTQVCAVTNDITIFGSNLSGANVKLDGVELVIKSSSSNALVVTLPSGTLGSKTITVSTANGSASVTINYATASKPKFQSIRIPYLSQGVEVNLEIIADHATSLRLQGRLPSGLTFNSATGLISGTPTDNGVFVLDLSAVGPCGEISTVLELDIDAPTPNAISHRINFLPGSCEISDSAKDSFLRFIEKVKGISPRNIVPDIYVSGGSKNSDPNSPMAECRQEAICGFLLVEDLLGEILTDVFTGSEHRIEIIVYWERPTDDEI